MIGNLAISRPGESPARTLARISRTAHNADLEAELFRDLDGLRRDAGWPQPHPQVQFDTTGQRRWRFDIAYFLPYKLAIEVDGGTWGRRNPRTGEWEQGRPGGHTTGAGYQRDCEKLNEAAILGWKVLRFTGADVRSGKALEYIQRALHLPPLGGSA